MRPYKLMEKFGVEIEYMITDRDSFDASPIADKLLAIKGGQGACDYKNGSITWSNELVNHVIELKLSDPAHDIAGMEKAFHENILAIEKTLAPMGATLLPGGMHPWMDPKKETVIWPHEGREIYEQYDRIFDCHRHGWANVQSVHLNISFQTDEEFERLHAAVRVLLPIIPALTAASPIADGKVTAWKDARLEFYRTNQAITPSIAGKIIPEAVFSEAEYEKEIFENVKAEIAPHDPEHLLNQYFLNSRGAIARFDRGSVEIRLIDTQESPKADFAYLALVIAILKRLVETDRGTIESLKSWTTDELADIFLGCVREGGDFNIEMPEYAEIFGMAPGAYTAKEIWLHIMDTLGPKTYADVYDVYREHGTLADRIVKRVGQKPSKLDLTRLAKDLNESLLQNRLFLP